MKIIKTLKITLIVLIIILISIISFLGVFKQNKNVMEGVLPEYLLSRDLKGYRMVELKAATDNEKDDNTQGEEAEAQEGEEATSDESENERKAEETENIDENSEESKEDKSKDYKKSKEIIKERLDTMQVADYLIRQNKEDGTIILELPENDKTDRVVGEIALTGKFEIVDHDTNEVLMTNDDIESVKAGYGTTSSRTTGIFINIQFNKDGKVKFKDITNTYVQTTVTKETTEENVNEVAEETTTQTEETESQNEEATSEPKTETVTKKIIVKLDDSQLLETYFDQEITNGILQLTMNTSNKATTAQMQESLLEARSLAALLNSGKMPISYTVEQNKYIASTGVNVKIIAIISGVILLLGIIYLVLKYKTKGILAGVSLIGYIALLLIAVRYFNVEISRGGLIALLYSVVISYGMIFSILKENEILKSIGKWFIILIPTLIVAITFTFANVLVGAVLFWGMVIALLYHISVSNLLLRD